MKTKHMGFSGSRKEFVFCSTNIRHKNGFETGMLQPKNSSPNNLFEYLPMCVLWLAGWLFLGSSLVQSHRTVSRMCTSEVFQTGRLSNAVSLNFPHFAEPSVLFFLLYER